MLQEHVATKCSGDKIALSTRWRDMLQGFVAGTCSRDQIAELAAHLWKSCRDVFQGHVAATHPLVCAGTFSLAQHEICAKFAPATCRKFKFNFNERMCRCRQHVSETRPGNFFTSVPTLRLGPCYMSLLHSPATCPVSVYLTRFCPRYILQQHVPATCPLVWAHLYVPRQPIAAERLELN